MDVIVISHGESTYGIDGVSRALRVELLCYCFAIVDACSYHSARGAPRSGRVACGLGLYCTASCPGAAMCFRVC